MWATEQRLLLTGYYNMDDFLQILASRVGASGTPRWLDSQLPTDKSVDVPYLGIVARFHQDEPITMAGSVAVFNGQIIQRGVTFMGKIIVGNDAVSLDLKTIAVSNPVSRKAYIMVPTVYRFVADGFIIGYDVDKVYLAGCGYYWRVVPVFSFIPVYYAKQVDYGSWYAVYLSLGEPDPGATSDIAYRFTYDAKVFVSSAPANTIIFEDDSMSSYLDPSQGLAALLFNVFKPWLTLTLGTVIGAYSDPLYSLFFNVAADYFGYTDMVYNIQGIAYYFQVSTTGQLNSAEIAIYKATGVRLTDEYSPENETSSARESPLMVFYFVDIDPPSGSEPPCDTICPLSTEPEDR